MKIRDEEEIRRDTIGAYLKRAREARGLTQRDIANALGYTTPQFISNWERGISSPPMSTYPVLVKLLGLDPGELIDVIAECHGRLLENERLILRKNLRAARR